MFGTETDRRTQSNVLCNNSTFLPSLLLQREGKWVEWLGGLDWIENDDDDDRDDDIGIHKFPLIINLAWWGLVVFTTDDARFFVSRYH